MSKERRLDLRQYDWKAGKSCVAKRIDSYANHYACFACRKMFNKSASKERINLPATVEEIRKEEQYPCPDCGLPMTSMGIGFKPPKRRDIKKWRTLEKQAKEGKRFWFIPSWL